MIYIIYIIAQLGGLLRERLDAGQVEAATKCYMYIYIMK